MIEEYDQCLINDLAAIAAALDQMSKTLPIYLSKIASFIGLNQLQCLQLPSLNVDEANESPSVYQISSLAYFILLLKGTKPNYSYGDLYTHCLLTQPMVKEYQQLINLILIYNSEYSYRIDYEQYQQFYNEFISNQSLMIQSKQNLNMPITQELLFTTISSIFFNETTAMTIDYLITELRKICDYFRHFKRHLSKKLLMLVYPSTYTNALRSMLFNSRTTSNGKLKESNISNTVNAIAMSRTQRIYNTCYYPIEYLSVMIIDKAINLKTNLSTSSSYVKELIINCIMSEVKRLRDCYGHLAASMRIGKGQNEVDLLIDDNLLKVDKHWIGMFIERINGNFLYVKAKDMIDNCYMKWLRNDEKDMMIQSDSLTFIAENNKENRSLFNEHQTTRIVSDDGDPYEDYPRISINDLYINDIEPIDKDKDDLIQLSYINNALNKDWRYRDENASLNFKQGKKKCKPSKVLS